MCKHDVVHVLHSIDDIETVPPKRTDQLKGDLHQYLNVCFSLSHTNLIIYFSSIPAWLISLLHYCFILPNVIKFDHKTAEYMYIHGSVVSYFCGACNSAAEMSLEDN